MRTRFACGATSHVRLMRNSFEMCRIDTPMIAADVIYFEFKRNGSLEMFIHQAMNKLLLARNARYAIAASTPTIPDPALAGPIDFAEQARDEIAKHYSRRKETVRFDISAKNRRATFGNY